MPPKAKYSKNDIIDCTFEMVRNHGGDIISARNVAVALGTSTAPIFTAFEGIEELTRAVTEKTLEFYKENYLNEALRSELPFKACGRNYIRFAKEERELFKNLFMRDRTSENYPEKPFITPQMKPIVEGSTGLTGDDAKLFHLEMWAYVHGIATMIATGFFTPDWNLINQMLTDAYLGLRKQHKTE